MYIAIGLGLELGETAIGGRIMARVAVSVVVMVWFVKYMYY